MKSPRSSRDTIGLGYTSIEEGESSKTTEERSIQGNNSKQTCDYYGKKGHTTNVYRSKNVNQNASQILWLTITSVTNKDIKHMNVGLEPQRYLNLKDTTTTTRSMDIEHLNVDLSLHRHQAR